MITNYEAAEKIQMDNLSALRQSHIEGVEEGRALGEERGIEKGKLEEKREIARKMKKDGLQAVPTFHKKKLIL
jgi:predicted transposase YdaD